MKQDSSKSYRNRKRDVSIDLLRGSAVLFMLITHINAVYLDTPNPVLDKLTFVGATICFSTFLFCSSYIYGVKLSKGSIKWSDLKHRVLRLSVIYFLLAFYITSFIGPLSAETIFKIVTLQELPIFIEFILAFVLFDIFIFIFQKPLSRGLKYPALLLVTSLVIYGLSRLGEEIDMGEDILNSYKALLFGHDDVHSFGLFSYFPFFTIGLIAGYSHDISLKVKRSYIHLGIFITSLILLIVSADIVGLRYERWPPSTLFHLYGITYISGFLLIVPLLDKIKPITGYLQFLSINAFEFYYLHVMLIFAISIESVKGFGDLFPFAMNILIFLLCSIGAYIIGNTKKRIHNTAATS